MQPPFLNRKCAVFGCDLRCVCVQSLCCVLIGDAVTGEAVVVCICVREVGDGCVGGASGGSVDLAP